MLIRRSAQSQVSCHLSKHPHPLLHPPWTLTRRVQRPVPGWGKPQTFQSWKLRPGARYPGQQNVRCPLTAGVTRGHTRGPEFQPRPRGFARWHRQFGRWHGQFGHRHRRFGRWKRWPAVSPPAPSQPPHCPIPGQSRGMREDQGDSREKFSDAGHAAPAGPGAVGTPPPSKAQVPSGAAGPLTHSFLCTPQGWAAVGAGDSAVRHLHSQAGNHHRWLWGRTALGPQQPGPGRSGQEPRGTGRGGAGPKEPPLRLGTLSRGRATLSRPSRCPGWPATDWRNSYLPRSSPVARSGRQPISSLLAHAPVSPFSPLPSNTVTFQPSPSIPQFRGTYLFIYLFSYLFILLSLQ
jgi:hypothetical protein